MWWAPAATARQAFSSLLTVVMTRAPDHRASVSDRVAGSLPRSPSRLKIMDVTWIGRSAVMELRQAEAGDAEFDIGAVKATARVTLVTPDHDIAGTEEAVQAAGSAERVEGAGRIYNEVGDLG